MVDKIVRPERRRLQRRQDRLTALGEAVDEGVWAERRVHCWDLEIQCTVERRKRCAAHFVKRNCWDLWAAEYFPPGRKPCCHPDLDCSQCPIATTKFSGPISVHVEVPAKGDRERTAAGVERPAAYCIHLYSLREGPDLPAGEEGRVVFRCQRRRGIQLHSSYVSEVCGSPQHRECIFYGNE